MANLRRLARALGAGRLAALAVVALGSLGFFAWLAVMISEPEYALLYGDLEMSDSSRIIAHLEAKAVPYRLQGGGTAVLVPRDEVARTRVELAEQSIPGGGSLGYELFDANSALGTTSFVQNVNLVRALEGELARTIRSIGTVKNARVHLVMPRRELFSRDRQEPSASILLQMRGAARLEPAQVVAIQNLVASAVPGLSSDRISLVDNRGTLLSRRNDGDLDPATSGATNQERRLELQGQLARTIEQLLERVVGPNRVRAEVSVAMNFDRVNTTEERYDPDGQVVRSSRNVEQKGVSNEHDDVPPVTVANELPNAGGAAGSTTASTSSDTRNDETINYEISRKVINSVRQIGSIEKLSVAVLVDGNYVPDAANDTATYQPRSAEELEQLRALVRGAIGFDAQRGDTVDVVNMRFADVNGSAEIDTGLFFGLDKDDLFRIGKFAALSVLALLVLLLVVRPIVSRLLASVPVAGGTGQPQLVGAAGQPAALAGPAGSGPASLPPPGEDMVDLEQVEGRVKASSVKKLGDFVERHPEQALAILRTWLHAED
ncbi:Flagellar M-ring protein [uncultured Defluviicoccus sp.]|uniref:Flagellar M-ring protein n=1 Tax=metagenome TaxID=256318 RepID=A0A380TGS8_9ZZZZ|nr:Flagellar M-ring protein [uncultured Defluviicoccus sp.]